MIFEKEFDKEYIARIGKDDSETVKSS